MCEDWNGRGLCGVLKSRTSLGNGVAFLKAFMEGFFRFERSMEVENLLHKPISPFWLVLEDGLHVCIETALSAFVTFRTGSFASMYAW
jgi:hypothetical protein